MCTNIRIAKAFSVNRKAIKFFKKKGTKGDKCKEKLEHESEDVL